MVLKLQQLNKNCRENYSAVFFLLIFIIFSNCSVKTNSFLVGSLPKKYLINDPRNPKCPCYQHQKKAEKEYRLSKGHFIKPNPNYFSSRYHRQIQNSKLIRKDCSVYFRKKTTSHRLNRARHFKKQKWITKIDACSN